LASPGSAPVRIRINFRTRRRKLQNADLISGPLVGTMAGGAKIVWPIPDLINALRIDPAIRADDYRSAASGLSRPE